MKPIRTKCAGSGVGLLLFLVACALHVEAATVQVVMQFTAFSPKNITINQGDTVTWVARENGHDVATDSGLFGSGHLLTRGETYSFTFDVPAGTYAYYCTPHRSIGMTGTVVVKAAANTPPVVALTSPAEAAIFASAESITFSANATDNGSVAKVEFFANDIPIGTSTSAPFSATASLEPGNYSVTAKATDDQGASTTSSAVSIVVNPVLENQPPTITLSASPALIAAGSSLTLNATATDTDGTVSKVEFFRGEFSVGEILNAPYALEISNLPPGIYGFTALATDNSGATKTSGLVEVRVATPPRIASITRTENGTMLIVTGTTGLLHTIEGSPDLSSWTEVGTLTPADGTGTMQDGAPGDRRYYRALVK